MAKNDAQVNQAMPHELKKKLQAAAKLNRRTLTSEINIRLERSLAPSEPNPSAESAGVLRDMDRKLSMLCDLIEAQSRSQKKPRSS